MIVLRNKEFSSKAQKKLRRAYDLQQGSTARYATGEDRLAAAKAQDKMVGRKKTAELLEKGEKSVTGSSKSILSRAIHYDTNKVKNRKELDEITRAQDLLRAGRERNRDIKWKSLYEGKRDNVNDTINKKTPGDPGWKWDRRDAIKQSRITNPKLVKESIAKHEARAAELRAKKVAGQKLVKNLKTAGKVGLGAATLVGGGVVAKKIYDKNKKA